MRCPSCWAENRGGARFGRACGTALVMVCSSCGRRSKPAAGSATAVARPCRQVPRRPIVGPLCASAPYQEEIVEAIMTNALGRQAGATLSVQRSRNPRKRR